MDPQVPQEPAPNAQTQSQSQPPPASVGEPLKKSKMRKIILMAFAGVLLLIMALFLGLRGGQKEKITVSITPTREALPSPTKIITPTPGAKLQAMKLLQGKGYYSDSVSLITKKDPHQVLTVSVTRAEQETNFLQYTSVDFFDGAMWESNAFSNTTANANISNNIVVRSWSNPNSQNNDQNKKLTYTFRIKNLPVSLESTTVQSEINLVSIPDYTKFIYQGEGEAVINNLSHEVYFTYSRAYSVNAANLEFFNFPSTLTSRALSLWDDQGNFYIIDSLSSTKKSNQSNFYKIAIQQDKNGATNKILNSDLTQNKEDAERFTARFTNQNFDFKYRNAYTKSGPKDTFVWTLGAVKGDTKVAVIGQNEQKSVPLLGLYEKIHAKN